MPNANAFSFSAETGKKYNKQHKARVVAAAQSATTYYYRMANGERGSTTTVNSIPVGAVVEARITS
jgi:hypothetical protein